MAILTFPVAIFWGSLSARLAVRCVTALIIALVCLVALGLSNVSTRTNFAGMIAGAGRLFLFGILLVGGYWVTSKYIIDYYTWNPDSIAATLFFIASTIYDIRQLPGKVLLTKMCAFAPGFMEAQRHQPWDRRIALAKNWRPDVKQPTGLHRTGIFIKLKLPPGTRRNYKM
jgi:hypothetical protein